MEIETIAPCKYQEDTCCIFEKCPMLKNCFPEYYKEIDKTNGEN